ncbi:MAG: NUDIX domain-containing protein [Culicoidibacterales bacterium]
MKTLKFEYTNWKGARKIREVIPITIKYGLTPHITGPEWLLEAEDVEKGENRLFILNHIERMISGGVERFLCVTIYVKKSDDRFLMMHHKKLNKWLPPGGKVDNNETPDEAAVRECLEETGVKINLIGEKADVENGLITPLGSQCNIIKKNVRDHVDLIYYGEPIDSTELLLSDREATDIGWFTKAEIENLDTYDSIKYWVNKILENK